MDADIDWCLNCERRVDGQSPYCSQQCRQANDYEQKHTLFRAKSTLNHTWRSIPDDDAAIAAWAAQIPPGPPPQSPSQSEPSTSSIRPPPVLLKPARRAVPPSLSITSPQQAQPHTLAAPTQPLLLTPRRHPSTASIAPSGYASMGQTSLCTPTSSLALATPPHASPVPIPIPTPTVTPLTLPHQHEHPPTTLHLQLQMHHRKPSAITDLFRSWAAPTHPNTPHRRNAYPTAHPIPVMHESTGSDSQGSIDQERGQWFAYERKPIVHIPRCEPTPRHHDEQHPSFRTRGRKASRAVA